MNLIGLSNPFDLTGPEFLTFYWAVAAAVVAAILVIRFMLRSGGQMIGAKQTKLDAYELAYLAGGPRRVGLLATAALAERGHVKILSTGSIQRNASVASASQGHSIEATLAEQARSPLPPTQITGAIRKHLDSIQHTLETQGLLVSGGARSLARFVCVGAVIGLILFGVIKMKVGSDRQKPIGWLVLSTIVTGVGGLIFAAGQPFRTRQGDELLSRARSQNRVEPDRAVQQPLDSPAGAALQPGSALLTAGLVMIALDGLPALAGSAQYEQYKRVTQSTGGDSGASSSCGTSSCSSGGGSDSGGGGCGGCGGGGGGD